MADHPDVAPPPDHEDFRGLQRFSFRGIKKYLDARRKAPMTEGIEEAARNEGRYLNDDELEPPPSDAAPVAWPEELLRYGGHRTRCRKWRGFSDCDCGWAEVYGRAVKEKVYPEDAPEGPWETRCFCGPGIERVQWGVRTSESNGISRDRRDRVITCDYQGLSKAEAIAVRDALNRGEGEGETDG